MGGEFNKGVTVPASTSVSRGHCPPCLPLSPNPDVSQFTSSPYVPGIFQAAAPCCFSQPDVNGDSLALVAWAAEPDVRFGPLALQA